MPADSLEQLEEDRSLAPATGTQEDDTAAASDGTDTAGRSTAAAARTHCNTSDDALDALYSNLKANTQHAPELRQYLCSQLRQAQGCIETIKACNSTGVAHPAEALIQKQDGLKNSTVRLKNFTEAGLQRGRKAKALPLGANTDSAESQAAPFKQPAPKRRKQTFTQQLQKPADRDRDKKNSSVAGSVQAAEPAVNTAEPAGVHVLASMSKSRSFLVWRNKQSTLYRYQSQDCHGTHR